MAMRRVCIQLTDELLEALERARGRKPRQALIEELLWRSQTIRKTGIAKPERPRSVKENEYEY